MRRILPVLIVLSMSCRLERTASGRPPGPFESVDSLALVEADSALRHDVGLVLNGYYEQVSRRDWGAVGRMFWPGATVAARFRPVGEPRDRVVAMSIAEFVRRAPQVMPRGSFFNERPMHTHVTGYGDLADAWVVYERRSGNRPDSLTIERGVDAFHLYRDRGEWRIAALTSAPEVPGRPLIPQRLVDSAQRPANPLP